MALHMVLSWSRKAAIVWSETKDMLAWLGCQTACFARLGGVPATVRIDNEKTAMARGAGAWGTVNPTYRRYATVLHFHVDACPPRQPRAKGKVERRVRDQRFALDPSRQAWTDLAELQQWTDDRLDALAHERLCPATGTSVAEAWASEKRCLTRLPETGLSPSMRSRSGWSGLTPSSLRRPPVQRAVHEYIPGYRKVPGVIYARRYRVHEGPEQVYHRL